MWQLRPPRDPLETPPPFMANAILNFHFDFWHPSLIGEYKPSLSPVAVLISKVCRRFENLIIGSST